MNNLPVDSLSIVIPVFNSQEILPDLLERLDHVLPGLAYSYEVILVNDGSHDNSWRTICNIVEKYQYVHGIYLKRNYGQHNATLCGIRCARYSIIVTMDDDLQHSPEEIIHLLEKLIQGYDIVYGVTDLPTHTWWRIMMSKIIRYFLASTMGIPRIRDISAFRAFRAHLRDAFQDYRNPNVIVDVLLSWGTNRFTTVTVKDQPRYKGKSNYNFMKLVNYTMVILTGFSTKPLRVASTLGFAFTIFGMLVFLYVFIVYLFLGSIPGFPFLASIISIFSGIQLFSLGIIGEYIARIFDRSIDRPPYVIGEITDNR